MRDKLAIKTRSKRNSFSRDAAESFNNCELA